MRASADWVETLLFFRAFGAAGWGPVETGGAVVAGRQVSDAGGRASDVARLAACGAGRPRGARWHTFRGVLAGRRAAHAAPFSFARARRGGDPEVSDHERDVWLGCRLRVRDSVGLGRTPSFWWTLNCPYNQAFDIHRLNGAMGDALVSMPSGSKQRCYDFVQGISTSHALL